MQIMQATKTHITQAIHQTEMHQMQTTRMQVMHQTQTIQATITRIEKEPDTFGSFLCS